MFRQNLTLLALAWVSMAAAQGCSADCAAPEESGGASVSVEVLDPMSVRDTATFTVLAVVRGVCPPFSQLDVGEIGEVVQMVHSPPHDTEFPMSGLPTEELAFIAMARRADCAVLAFGCTSANLNHHKIVRIQINETVDPPSGACDSASGERCDNGFCV